jgi:HlyD family secretion protein
MRRLAVCIPGVIVIALAACARGASSDPSAVGSIEYTETDVSPIVSARVLRVLVDEGVTVRAGDTLALLTQSTLAPEIDQRRARVAAAEAEVRDLRQGARPAEIGRAAADVAAASAEAERARRDAGRYRQLQIAGHVGAAQAEAMESAARVAESRLTTARESLRLLRQGTRPEQVRSAEASVRAARAQLAAAEATSSDLVLLAPQDGVVIGRYVEPGEVIAAGVPAVSLGDVRRIWVRVYVAAPLLAAIRVGQDAVVQVEGLVGRTFKGRVASINTRAEFTPRVALTEKERADLLFGVKVEVTDTTGTLKAGLPATVSFPPTTRSGSANGR